MTSTQHEKITAIKKCSGKYAGKGKGKEKRCRCAALLFQARSNEPDLCGHRHFCYTTDKKERLIIRGTMNRRALHRLHPFFFEEPLTETTRFVTRFPYNLF